MSSPGATAIDFDIAVTVTVVLCGSVGLQDVSAFVYVFASGVFKLPSGVGGAEVDDLQTRVADLTNETAKTTKVTIETQ